MQELKKQILTEISNKWNFEKNSLLNDIPIATSEKSNNEKWATIYNLPQDRR